MVEVEHRAFANVDEEADILLAPGEDTLVKENWQGKGSSDWLQHVLLRTTDLLRSATSIGRALSQAANALPTGDYTTEEAEHWVTNILAGGWAASLHCLFHQGIVILWEAH
jgi:hypothetical protein